MEWQEDAVLIANYVLSVAEGGPQYIMPGGFAESLVATIFHADRNNRRRLAQGYPVIVAAVVKYKEDPNGYLALRELAKQGRAQ